MRDSERDGQIQWVKCLVLGVFPIRTSKKWAYRGNTKGFTYDQNYYKGENKSERMMMIYLRDDCDNVNGETEGKK